MIFQVLATLLTIGLVVVSFGLTITVPVALATPGQWEENKPKFISLFQLWISIIISIAGCDGFALAIPRT